MAIAGEFVANNTLGAYTIQAAAAGFETPLTF